jgi:general stress protein 26
MEKNLQKEEALKKFRELVDEIQVCMFITDNKEHEHTRPMATIEIEDDGTLWFYTDIRSIKVEEVSMTRNAHLVYAHPGKNKYLDVRATAKVVTDKQMIIDKWNPIVKSWFPNGVTDPYLGLLEIKPLQCHYWDAKTGKMVEFLKMATSVVSGKQLAEGAEGQLNL